MIDLRYFAPDEFRNWWGQMSPRLLVLLDVLRYSWGQPIIVSPAEGALGRHDAGESQHNIDQWGEVRAADVMPDGIGRASQVRQCVEDARVLGFTGIGVYPHWSPSPGLHLDVRESRDLGDPATWGALSVDRATQGQRQRGSERGGQVYLSLDEAVAAFPT